MRTQARLLLAAVLLAGAACSSSDSSLPFATIVFTTASGPVTKHVEVAATPEARQRGLMGRTSLPTDSGMLFVFGGLNASGFYMKNTLIPLDIAFIARGTVVDVASMTPCKTKRCPVTYSKVPYDWALEVAAGGLEKSGITVGTKAEVDGTLPTPA